MGEEGVQIVWVKGERIIIVPRGMGEDAYIKWRDDNKEKLKEKNHGKITSKARKKKG